MTNAPPASPPRKKYRSIMSGQSALWSSPGSMAIPLPLLPIVAVTVVAAATEGEQRAESDCHGGADGEHRIQEDVSLGQLRLLRQPVLRRLAEKEEEGVEAAERPALVGSVE